MDQFQYLTDRFLTDMGLFFLIKENEEILVIAKEEDIRAWLLGDYSNILAEQHQETGTWLNDLYALSDSGWVSAVQGLYNVAYALDHSCKKRDAAALRIINDEEETHRAFLAGKIESGHLLNQYVALRILKSYTDVRQSRSKNRLSRFLRNAQNMVRPLCEIKENQADCNFKITENCDAWNWGLPMTKEDLSSRVVASGDYELIGATWSLMPIRSYYLKRFAAQHKCSIKCKLCGKRFFAPSLMIELCSAECREISRKASVDKRKGTLAYQVDILSRREYQHWLNRINLASKSGRWSESDITRLKLEMKQFQQRKNPKNEECRKGQISFDELTDWYMREREHLRKLMSQ